MTLRPLLALTLGVIASCVIGLWCRVDEHPLVSLTDPASSASGALGLLAVACAAGTVTPLIAWRHTPGLPGMTLALSLAVLGALGGRGPGGPAVVQGLEAMLVLAAVLVTYSLAWATDTYIVFRKLTVRPAGKKVDTRVMLTRLLPCCGLTAAGGGLLAWALSPIGAAGAPVAFGVMGYLCSRLFTTPSTLWYAAAGPVYAAGVAILTVYLSEVSGTPGGAAMPTLALCGLASAGAILGHWVWRISKG